jgi:DinB superfamily
MSDVLSSALGKSLADEMNDAFGRIRHCVDQLNDEQIWRRPHESMNSIGNLLLHLAGNLRQYLVSGLGGAPDTRDRPKEFSARGPTPGKAALLGQLETVLADARAALEKQTPADWLRVRPVQDRQLTGLQCAVQSVSHCRGHTQEIIHMTRFSLGDGYRFAGPRADWAGATPR